LKVLSKNGQQYLIVQKPIKDILNFLDKKQLKDEWKKILIEYQNKLLFATDAHKKHRWKKYSKIVKLYRDILNQLPEEVSKKIAYLNAERIYDIKN